MKTNDTAPQDTQEWVSRGPGALRENLWHAVKKVYGDERNALYLTYCGHRWEDFDRICTGQPRRYRCPICENAMAGAPVVPWKAWRLAYVELLTHWIDTHNKRPGETTELELLMWLHENAERTATN